MIKKQVNCAKCDGKGWVTVPLSENSIGFGTCSECRGTGVVEVSYTNRDKMLDIFQDCLPEFLTKMCSAIEECDECPLFPCHLAANSKSSWRIWLNEEIK